MKTRLFLIISIIFLMSHLLALGDGQAVSTADISFESLESSTTSLGTTIRVSIASDKTEANGPSGYQRISDDGRFVAFTSYANNLVVGDTNASNDVFIHELQTGITQRVSIANNNSQGNNDSWLDSISSDGRYIAFGSIATNLVAGDTNNAQDAFVHDRQTGTTQRVSIAKNGAQSNGESYYPSISGDGRFVAFQSSASNLVDGDTNNYEDIFIFDRQTLVTQRVSVSSNGTQGNNGCQSLDISLNGRYVVFDSWASNLVSEDTNGSRDVFLHDRETGTTQRVSIAKNGAQSNGESYSPSISGDGRFVAFQSSANNLVDGDTNGTVDVFIHDRQTGITERISVDSNGTQGNNASIGIEISSDGNYVTFTSNANNLVNGDTNNYCDNNNDNKYEENCFDIFFHDRMTGITQRISIANNSTEGNNASLSSDISSDGRLIAFQSFASNLVSGDTNNYCETDNDGIFNDNCSDIFVRDRGGESESDPWLLMYYLAGDNSLSDIQNMMVEILKQGVEQPAYNIAIMIDSSLVNDSRYYYIADNIVFERKNELNSGDPNTLVDFVNWARNMFPVEHTALIISDHGSLTGVAGVAYDESQNDFITLVELGTALQSITSQNGKIDILFLEDCLMGTIESAYQVMNFADYYIASENILFVPPMPRYLDQIDASTIPMHLALLIAENYHIEMGKEPHTISVANLSVMANLVAKVNTFAEILESRMSDIGGTLIKLQILNEVQRFDSNFPECYISLLDESLDLYDFARLAKEKSSDTSIINSAQEVMNVIQDDPNPANRYIILNEVVSGTISKYMECSGLEWNLDKSHGVSSFFPKPDFKRSFYNVANLAFANGTIWNVADVSMIGEYEEIIHWGSMLVSYVDNVSPNAPDDPSPPPLRAPIIIISNKNFIPIINR